MSTNGTPDLRAKLADIEKDIGHAGEDAQRWSERATRREQRLLSRPTGTPTVQRSRR